MASARTIEDISRDLNEVKNEIKQVKQSIANAKSDAHELQDKIRLNNLDADKKKLEKERMFPLAFAPLGFSRRSLLSFATLLFCAPARFFPDRCCSGACTGTCCWWEWRAGGEIG